MDFGVSVWKCANKPKTKKPLKSRFLAAPIGIFSINVPPSSLFYYNKTITKGFSFIVPIRSECEIVKLKY